jgi:hypothetical protein
MSLVPFALSTCGNLPEEIIAQDPRRIEIMPTLRGAKAGKMSWVLATKTQRIKVHTQDIIMER